MENTYLLNICYEVVITKDKNYNNYYSGDVLHLDYKKNIICGGIKGYLTKLYLCRDY